MKYDTFMALLIAARPEKYMARIEFTNKVMSAINSSEIFSSHVRKMNVNKKETFIMKLRHLPKFAIVAIALGALLLLSTGVYATYQLLWPKPQVEVSAPTTSASGRKEVVISLATCGDARMAQRYELKRNAPITADQVAGVVKAHCELQIVGSWAQKEFGDGDRSRMRDTTEPYDSEYTSTSMATHIKSRDASSITFVGLTKYNQPDKTLALTSNVRYFAEGIEVKAGDITENDPVVYITKYREHMTPQPGCNEMHCSISGTPLGEDLLAVVKLSMPFENYDQLAWQSLIEKQSCMGNESETCLTGFIGGIDLYTNNGLSPSVDDMKEIQGTITKIESTTVTIKSSSGTLYTVKTTTDIVSDYNLNRAPQYNNQKVQVGNSLMITYKENKAEHAKTLTSQNILSIMLQLEMISKGDSPNAY